LADIYNQPISAETRLIYLHDMGHGIFEKDEVRAATARLFIVLVELSGFIGRYL
jgi:hypothetical protein